MLFCVAMSFPRLFTRGSSPRVVAPGGRARLAAHARKVQAAGRQRVRLVAELGLVLAGIIWGGNFVLVKVAVERMPPFYYLGLRFLVGAIVLAPFCIGRLRRLRARGWFLGLGIGALLFGGFALQTVGLQTTSPGMSGFLTSVYVVLVPLILGVVAGRWPSPLVWLGIAMVMGGLAVLSLYGRVGFGWGEGLTLLANVFWALHILGVGYACTRYSAMALVQLQLTACAVLALIVAFAFERPALFPGWEATGAVLWTGIMGGVVAYILMTVGQRHVPLTLAGVLMSLEAVFALITGLLFGYDALTVRMVIGFVLVFAGTTVARLGSEKRPELAAEPAPPGP